MSDDIAIHAWLGEDDLSEWPVLVDRLLGRIGYQNYQLEAGGGFVLRTYDPFGELRSELTLSSEALSRDLCSLVPFSGDLALEIVGSYQYASYASSSSSLQPRRRPFQVKVAGPWNGYEGFECRSNGPLRITFDNVKSFLVPAELVQKTKKRYDAAIPELKMMADISRNYEIVSDVLSATIEVADPSTAMVCIAAQVHPLTAQAVYHANLTGFIADCDEIARLHNQSGFYLAESLRGVALNPPVPRNEVYGYGYYRSEEATFRRSVEETFVGHQWADSLTETEVRIALDDPTATEEVEAIGRGVCVKTQDPPLGYVDQFYFRLVQRRGLVM